MIFFRNFRNTVRGRKEFSGTTLGTNKEQFREQVKVVIESQTITANLKRLGVYRKRSRKSWTHGANNQTYRYIGLKLKEFEKSQKKS